MLDKSSGIICHLSSCVQAGDYLQPLFRCLFVCLCWGLTSQSTIFQSCRDEATASWVINQYFRGVKCLAQGHNTAAVGFESPTSRSGVRHSTTEPPRSPCLGWLCWGLTSQSTIFQSCRDGAIASWVINQYFWGVKCLAQGHNTAEVGLEPRTSRSGVRHSTTEPPRSPCLGVLDYFSDYWSGSCTVGTESDCKSRGHEFEPKPGHIIFVKTEHEINYSANFPFTLIQEHQLSDTAKVCALN